MTMHTRSKRTLSHRLDALARRLVLATSLLAAAAAAQAQYKIVGPDGKITYADRPPTAAGNQVQPLRATGGPNGAAVGLPGVAGLPAELRPIATRFPVMLYTSADCQPCDVARKLLQARGVPFTERTVGTDDDIAALSRLTGGRSVPALSVGAQALRGFLESDWNSTLDLAGYPRESRLPRSYQGPAPTPLVARSSAEVPLPAAVPFVAAEPPPAEPAPAASGGIRF